MRITNKIMFSRSAFHAGTWPELSQHEYNKCKKAMIRVYKLACKDAYCELGLDNFLTDAEIVQRANQTHPAVLLKELRLITSVRLAVKASWDFWKVLFAGMRGTRSWLTSLHHDIRWLRSCTTTFQELDVNTLGPWLVMARDHPRSTIAAIRKSVAQEKAVHLACAMAAPVLIRHHLW